MSEKRTVSTDALETLGTILGDGEKRDAIHLAVIPVTAGANIAAGHDVCLDNEGLAINWYEGVTGCEPLGIADPFIRTKEYNNSIKPGEKFWLVIYPRKITSLRHVWSHPAFPDESASLQAQVDDAREESRKWLEGFATRLFSYEPNERGSRFDALMAGAEYGAFGTDIEYSDDTKPTEEFWMHYERYTGKKVATRHEFFQCAC